MSLYVVDASVAAKWFFDEVHTAQARRLLDPSHGLSAPEFLLVEVDSLLCKRAAREEITADEARRIRKALRRMPLRTHALPPLQDLAFEVALRTTCSIYDALYVALAALTRQPLVTADRRLLGKLATGLFARHVLWIEDLPV